MPRELQDKIREMRNLAEKHFPTYYLDITAWDDGDFAIEAVYTADKEDSYQHVFFYQSSESWMDETLGGRKPDEVVEMIRKKGDTEPDDIEVMATAGEIQ